MEQGPRGQMQLLPHLRSDPNLQSLAGKTVSEEELKALVHQRIARAMLGYMLYMNEKENEKYTCNTCHQGSTNVKVKE